MYLCDAGDLDGLIIESARSAMLGALGAIADSVTNRLLVGQFRLIGYQLIAQMSTSAKMKSLPQFFRELGRSLAMILFLPQ
jgi:hypothetical protein